MRTVTGSCLCKSVKISFPLEREGFDVCHCSMCRKWGGGPMFTVDGAGPTTIEGEEFITVYESSAWAERAFCKSCGTHLYWQAKKDGFRNYPLGLVEGNEELEFLSQLYIDKKPKTYSFTQDTEVLTAHEAAKLI